MADDILIAVESAAIRYDGDLVFVHKGRTRVRKGHPILKGNEHLFGPIDVHYDVEQATRAPGERRGRTRPANDK